MNAKLISKQKANEIKEEIINVRARGFERAIIRVIRLVQGKPHYFAGQGDKLFRHDPTAQQPQPGQPVIRENSYATLGCYGKTSDGTEVALTTSHFVQVQQSVYFNDNSNQMKKFGDCVQSIDTNEERYIEIAVVQLSDYAKNQPHEKRIYGKDGPERSRGAVEEDLANLRLPLPVFKNGATSGWTDGFISQKLDGQMNNIILVESSNLVSNEDLFADEGDSGSIVLAQRGDAEAKILNALAMVLGMQIAIQPENTAGAPRSRSVSESSAASDQSTDDDALQDLEDSVWCSDLAKSLKLLREEHHGRMAVTFYCDEDMDVS